MTVSNISNDFMLYEGFLPRLPWQKHRSISGGRIFSYTGAQISGKRPRRGKFGQFKGRIPEICCVFGGPIS